MYTDKKGDECITPGQEQLLFDILSSLVEHDFAILYIDPSGREARKCKYCNRAIGLIVDENAPVKRVRTSEEMANAIPHEANCIILKVQQASYRW